MTSEYANIKLLPCRMCGGLPVSLILPLWPHHGVRIECAECGARGPMVYFDQEGPIFQGTQRLLPGLAKARRQAAAMWNEGTCGSGGGASG